MSWNKDWKPGDAIDPGPEGEKVAIDPKEVDLTTVYKLMIGGIVPRPIAFVSTMGLDGVGNLAPFSYFNAVGSNPPAIMIAIANRSDGEQKDTLRNILSTKEFVVNSVNEWMVEPMNYCSGEFPYGVNEMELVGLTPEASLKVRPPRVRESALQLECRLFEKVVIGDGSSGSTVLIVGEIVQFHINSQVYAKGRIDIQKYRPVARLGGLSYCTVGEIHDLPRP